MQAGGHVPSGISVARSATEGRGVEGLADGDERVGAEGAESESITERFLVFRPLQPGLLEFRLVGLDWLIADTQSQKELCSQ